MRDAGCGMRDAGCGMRGSASRIPHPASRKVVQCGMRDAGCGLRIPHPASRIPHPALKLELASVYVTVCLSINFRLVIAVHAVHRRRNQGGHGGHGPPPNHLTGYWPESPRYCLSLYQQILQQRHRPIKLSQHMKFHK